MSSPSEEEASSEASSTTSPYVAGAGPGFDPNQPLPDAPENLDGEVPGQDAFGEAWEEEQLRSWLITGGDALHATFGVGEYDWAMTRRDLERIAPPATRILNRYQPSRAVAAYSDPGAVAVGAALYAWRSMLERKAVLQAQAREEREGAPPPQSAADATAGHPDLTFGTQP